MKTHAKDRGFLPGVLTGGVLTAALAGSYALGRAQNNPPAPDAPPVVQTAGTRDAAAMQNAFAEVAHAASPAVVTIITRSPRRNTDGDDIQDNQDRNGRGGGGGGGLGSGMIYRADGFILTNAHVVRGGGNTVRVRLQDERELPGRVLGSDAQTDLAVVKIDAQDLPTVKLGDSSAVRPGDWAIALGNPFGLPNTLTVGVISAVAREVPLAQRGLTDYLQTDASINPGNSGGPLLDIYGRVVGVNSAIFSESGGNEGVGFSIPINLARDIASRIVRDGRVARGTLGVQYSTRAEDNQKGVLIRSVRPGSAAYAAGLRDGDIVQEFAGQTVSRPVELQRAIGNAPVDTPLRIKVLRDGQPQTLTVRLTEAPAVENL